MSSVRNGWVIWSTNVIKFFFFQAITEVGEVIQFYDADKRFPAWGFGGRTAGGPVSHCFNLDGTATGFEVN